MEFTARTIILPNNAEITLRSPKPSDAAEMLRYKVAMSGETEYVGRYPEEITETLPEEMQSIADTLQSGMSILITAFSGERIAANAGIFPVNGRMKLRHRAEFCIAVLRPWWRMGVGRLLSEECLRAAAEMGYKSVELSASAANASALKLYRSLGFQEYGRLQNAYALKDGTFDESVFMTRELETHTFLF